MEDFYDMATAAEANSEHPMAKVVVRHTKRLCQELDSPASHVTEAKEFEVHTGESVEKLVTTQFWSGTKGSCRLVTCQRILKCMTTYPSLRVAYVDEVEKTSQDKHTVQKVPILPAIWMWTRHQISLLQLL